MKSVGILGTLLLVCPAFLSAQRVASLEFAEPGYTLEVGETFEVFVDASDSLGDFVEIESATWTSSNPDVVAVQPDVEIAGIASLTGVGPGTALVSVTVQGVSASLTVSVTGPARAEVTPDSVLTVPGAERIAASTVRLEVSRFASETECAAATIPGRDGLIVTTYSTIRGADRVVALSATGRSLGDVRVAAYDAALDLAILAPTTPPEGEPIAESVTPEGYFWVAGFPDCGSIVTVPVDIVEVEQGELRLAGDVTAAFAGGAIADNTGRVVAVARAGSTAAGSTVVAPVLDEASSNVVANSVQSPRQVAVAEGHLFGAINLQSPIAGAAARITPVGATAWPEIATERPLPYTFAGPAGAYNASLIVDGQVRATRVLRVQAGVTAREVLEIPLPLAQQPPTRQEPVQQPPPGAQIPQASGGGGFPVPLLVVGVIGGGVAALLASKKTPSDTTSQRPGRITIVVPVP